MAERDLAVLRDLFHTLNDAGISLPELNSSIALLEKYLEENREFADDLVPGPSPSLYREKSVVWKNSSRTFAYTM